MALFCSSFSYGQTIITIGNGTTTNTGTSYPAPYGNFYWGAKHQIIIQAAELQAAGMSAGDINSLAFNVATPNGTPMVDFTIGLKNTTTATVGGTFETGATTVYGPQTYTETAGWNTHTFSSPFYWDGTSNLLVETCFNNTAWTNNAQMYYTTTSFQSVGYYRADQAGVCALLTPVTQSSNRPNIQFDWNPGNVPPDANFSSNTTYTCSGLVDFTDLSLFNPTSWQWDFGDGNTSTQQNPSHTYLTNGTYSVELIACNAFGCDTTLFSNYITVNTGAGTPAPASCTPNTLTYCCGFGITNVMFNTINNSTNDGADGYGDFTCLQTTVTEGQNYTLTIETPTPTTHNAAAWIDFNNDGVLNDVTERVFTSSSELIHSGTVTIPNGAVLNTPLRLRVAADYDFSAPPTPCTDIDFGQAEDYTIIIQANTSPPVADFTVNDTLSCTGVVSFTDLSTNLPIQWMWDFGDGNMSNQQFPTHTYTASGTYTVTLTATNAFGNDVYVATNLVTVNLSGALTAPACTPNTLSYCCGYGIYNVTFNTIDFDSPDGSEGFQDNSCTQVTSVTEGLPYTLSVRTGQNSPQDTRAWIDFNNDGTLDPSELVFEELNTYNPAATVNIPGGAVLNTPLRLRISSDVVGGALTSCDDNSFGQTEDYGLVITANTNPPLAGFFTDSTLTCTGVVNFTDTSTNGPTSWLWDFGDGGSSTAQNPTHTYTTPGVYTVSLVATNSNGSDQATYTSYVNYDPNGCTTHIVPQFGTVSIDQCSGTIYDNGGPTANYANFSNGIAIIQPTGAVQITATFTFFDLVTSSPGDTLYLYDGPSTASPLIGAYTGNPLPNGGAPLTTTGGALTLRMVSDANITDPGFVMEWTCVTGTGGPDPVADFNASATNICASECINFTDLSTNSPSSWNWTFPGATPSTSTSQNPTNICYNSAGSYDVTLSVTNANGTHDTTFVNYITVADCSPVADFSVSATSTCSGLCLDFTDQSTNSPTSWAWTFAGGTPATSTAQNPTVCYASAGTYNVTLLVTNASGNDDTVSVGLITITNCDTVFVPTNSSITETECSGVIQDSGGPGNYIDNNDGSVSIVPSGANTTTVSLTFSTFNYDASDTLYIYDGASTSDPLIGAYTGTALPNGGTVSATGPAITVREVTDGSVSNSGFNASWSCLVDGIEEETGIGELLVYPNPASETLNLKYSSSVKQGSVYVFLTNTLGQPVYTELYSQQNFTEQIDISRLPAGMYFVVLQVGDHKVSRKVIIE